MASFSSERRSRRLSTRVGPGASGELTHELEESATVERVDVRFYPGPQLDLELRPFGEVDSNRFDLLDLTGRDVVVGDDDRFSFDVSVGLSQGDVVGVEFSNVDPSNGFDFVVDLTLERAGGIKRLTQVI